MICGTYVPSRLFGVNERWVFFGLANQFKHQKKLPCPVNCNQKIEGFKQQNYFRPSWFLRFYVEKHSQWQSEFQCWISCRVAPSIVIFCVEKRPNTGYSFCTHCTAFGGFEIVPKVGLNKHRKYCAQRGHYQTVNKAPKKLAHFVSENPAHFC